jgi:hypothetical protein
LGANFSFHPIPQIAFDTGLGLAVTGLRLGVRARYNFLKGEWTPFLGGGLTYSGGTNGDTVKVESKGEQTELQVLESSYAQLAGGVNYTGTEGFVFMATTGYSWLLNRPNTRYVSGSTDTYNDVKGLYRGGVIVSLAFGYAF